MQKRRGKAWEILCARTSGRQRVDTWGAVPDHCNSRLCVDQPVLELNIPKQQAVLMLPFAHSGL